MDTKRPPEQELDSQVSDILTKTKSMALYKFNIVANSPKRHGVERRLSQLPLIEKFEEPRESKVHLLQRLQDKDKMNVILSNKKMKQEQKINLSPYGVIKKKQ